MAGKSRHSMASKWENTSDELWFFSFNVFWQYYPLAISEFTMENGWFVDDLLEKWGGFSMGMLDPQRARSTLDEPHVEGPYNTWIGEHSPKRIIDFLDLFGSTVLNHAQMMSI